MNVYYQLSELPEFKNAVVTIGSFDGVHTGHQRILERVNQIASALEGESIVITFHPHPRHVIYPDQDSLKLLSTINEKVDLLEKYGIHNVVVVPFTKEFSQQEPEDYIRNFLFKKFQPQCLVIGYDHRFGKNRGGDIHFLNKFKKEQDFEIVEIKKQEVEDITVSSTKIRKALENGDISTANHLLNYSYSISGIVVKGQGIGEKIGFPTANVEILDKHKLIPAEGIYAVWVYHLEKRYQGMLYIGTRPVLKDHHNRTIEVNIFDFNKSIYGERIKIEFVKKLRNDIQFQQFELLQQQLLVDKEQSISILEELHKKETMEVKGVEAEASVVILNYNGAEYLKKFLPVVRESSYPNKRIIVADNGSTDKSLEILRNDFPDVEVLDLKFNYGFAGGYNEALKQIDSDYFILLNSDVEVTKDWLEPLIELMEKDKTIGACQPKVRDYKNKPYFEYAGASGGWMDSLGYPFCRGRVFNHVEEDLGQYDSVDEIFWATGAAMVVRPKLFHQLEGFDKDHFAHLEEIDLCWRIRRAGYKIMAQPQSVVYHVGGGTLDYLSPRKTYLNFRNSLYTLLKNEPVRKLMWLLPLRFILDGLAGVLFLIERKFSHIGAILRAHFSFYRSIPKLLKKRKHYKELIEKISITSENSPKGVLGGSVVWKFYAQRIKKFKDLF